MTWLDDEQGQDSAEPWELYTFTTTSQTFRYTSGPSDYTYAANVYTRIPIERSSIRVVQTREKSELIVEMPIDIAVVNDIGQLIAPTNTSMSIRRIHPVTGNHQIIWSGQIIRVDIKGRKAQFAVHPNLSILMDASTPPRVFTRFCNHQLFDTRCGLNRNSYDYTTTIDSVNGSEIILAVGAGGADSPQGAGPLQRFSGGEILRATDGERRRIVRQATHTITGAYPGVPSSSLAARTMYLNMPFRDLAVGDTVTVWPGCAKSAYECKNKFNNIAKFGGFPLVPLKNLYAAVGGVKGVD